MTTINIDDVKWEPSVYPRSKWNTATIERYSDAMEAGEVFPALTLQEGTNILLDGKHRLEAYKKAGIKEIPVELRKVPDGMSLKYFAATLSARHGDRLSNADLKELAEIEFEADPALDPVKWGQGVSVSQRTVYSWVSHILNRAKAGRESKAWRLAKLGWTQKEIAERLGVAQSVVSEDIGNCNLAKIDTGAGWNDKGIAEWANRTGSNLTDAWAAALDGDDKERLDKLDIKIKPYDVWNFSGCHDLMGDKHPGRIPGELVCHVLYFYTKPGDLVIDPMAGSGTTLDACLLMGRKARGYDIDEHHNRIDIEKHNLSEGWPSTAAKARMIFWDPPYFDKMDNGYVDGSISGLEPDAYLKWLSNSFKGLAEMAKSGVVLAFLMSDWDPENAKKHGDSEGIFLWDYVRELQKAGWKIKRQIQVPLSTQQVHPDIVNKFRESRRLARLGRYLLIGEKV